MEFNIKHIPFSQLIFLLSSIMSEFPQGSIFASTSVALFLPDALSNALALTIRSMLMTIFGFRVFYSVPQTLVWHLNST